MQPHTGPALADSRLEIHKSIHTTHKPTVGGRVGMEGWIDVREKRQKRDRYSSDRQRDGWIEEWRE